MTRFLLLFLIAFSLHAQTDYPSKPIKLVVPYPAGGGADTLARLTAEGYPFTPIVETIGLQFADLFVNIWRHLHFGAYPQLRVSRRILRRAKQTDYFWAPDASMVAPAARHS